MSRFTTWMLSTLWVCLLAGSAHGQDLVRSCLDGSDDGDGLELFVDNFGVIHLSHAALVSGNLSYTRIEADGSAVREGIANRIHRFPNNRTRATGITLSGGQTFVCFQDPFRDQVRLGIKTDGVWSTEVIEDNALGDGCSVLVSDGTIHVFYEGDGRLRWARRPLDGAWNRSTVDGTSPRTGVFPHAVLQENGLPLVVYRDETNRTLMIAVRAGNAWNRTAVLAPIPDAGLYPRVVLTAGGLAVFHASEAGEQDVETDGSLLQTTGPIGGPYETNAFNDFAVGGYLGAMGGDRGLFLITRQFLRSALFGDSDALVLYSGDPLEPEVLEQFGPAQNRHTYRFTRVAADPFGLPVVAFVDAIGGADGSAPICYWRPRDSDADQVPDEIEIELGTDPALADTDGDGRTDGEEILRDGTDPLSGDVCIPIAEVCNGVDDDCDERVDELPDRECYDGPNGTAGLGQCRFGQQSCVNGRWSECVGQIAPALETCEGTDQDCDGVTDEEVIDAGDPCETPGVGVCATGLTICFAAQIRCLASEASSSEVCNTLDDDCDGTSDEGSLTCGVGVCARTVPACLGGADNPCQPGEPVGRDSSCDGNDQDCDGRFDEFFIESETTCGVGRCSALGRLVCVNGQTSDTCTPGVAQPDTTCDGLDDDCDGRVDEAFTAEAPICGNGVCRAVGTTVCLDGRPVEECVPGDPQGPDTTCDGVDDDCDGRVDEAYVPEAIVCGAGGCEVPGVTRCINGAVQQVCDDPELEPDTTCDGVDQDCDGRIDEGFVSQQSNCGRGECASTGQLECVGGQVLDTCRPRDGQGNDDDCDGRDDDCDGRTDESFVPQATSCGRGVCLADGFLRCVNGAISADCQAGEPTSGDDECDGTDNDCDGRADEAFMVTPAPCGVGACRESGQRLCQDGAIRLDCVPGEPVGNDDTCDGIDSDCDGQVDEGFVSTPTACGQGACSATGETRCVDGAVQDTCTLQGSEPDTRCDGIDQDCDGRVDEAFQGRATQCGQGLCAATSIERCDAGQIVDPCTPGAPQADDGTCDGLDSDCDGRADEDFVGIAVECGTGVCRESGSQECRRGRIRNVCTPGNPDGPDTQCDGVDQDCDGSTDEAFRGGPVQCGVGACQAEGQERCVAGVVEPVCVPAQGTDRDPTCDGIDEDCDGQVDEDFAERPTSCGIGACRRDGVRGCQNGLESTICNPGAPAGADDACDGLDDDCDGNTDEGFIAPQVECGVGACRRDGLSPCIDGDVVDRCEPGPPSGDDSDCNGVDDDCDGAVDEAWQNLATQCGEGVCRGTGRLECRAGALIDTCEAGLPQNGADLCDGEDSDCDGRADEDHQAAATTCGVGACARNGRGLCVNGEVVDTCAAGQPALTDAECDGIDSDCDGNSDEDFNVSESVCGVGVCAASGQLRCDLGRVIDSCRPDAPIPGADLCDGRDSDCDGRTDEGHTPDRIICGTGACEAEGQTLCQAGQLVESCTPGAPQGRDSACDGFDADCDGRLDERFRGTATQCGAGVCARDGLTQCVAGQVVDACVPGEPTGIDDTCDGVDDDCDGRMDEAYQSRRTECGRGVCFREGSTRCVDGQELDDCEPGPTQGRDSACDGIDADCDGRFDERFVSRESTCGVGACAQGGRVECIGGRVVDSCQPGQRLGDDTNCDGVDDDCDGRVDEGYATAVTTCGIGVCQRTGERVCVDGVEQDSCNPGEPQGRDSQCDGIDADCDGRLDERAPSRQTSCGIGACAREGRMMCVGGRMIDTCTPLPAAEDDAVCDGVDEDCDDRIDEDFRVERFSCGQGACEEVGVIQCLGGERLLNCRPGQPAPNDQICDGVDSDCDGLIDEDFNGQVVRCGLGICATEVIGECVDGAVRGDCRPRPPVDDDNNCNQVDDDCDGQIDEAAAGRSVCGTGSCTRRGRTQCVDGQLEDDCEPGQPAENDRTCDGLDDDCDDVVDEDCRLDAGSPASDTGTGSIDAGAVVDGAQDTGHASDGQPADSAPVDLGSGDAQEVDGSVDLDGSEPTQTAFDQGACIHDGTCPENGFAENQRAVREGCDCRANESGDSQWFLGILLIFMGGAIRRRRAGKHPTRRA